MQPLFAKLSIQKLIFADSYARLGIHYPLPLLFDITFLIFTLCLKPLVLEAKEKKTFDGILGDSFHAKIN